MRPIKGIQSFSREIVVALIANCESLELQRKKYASRGLPPEHPCASSTDDVEGFFSLLHDQLGDVFHHKVYTLCIMPSSRSGPGNESSEQGRWLNPKLIFAVLCSFT